MDQQKVLTDEMLVKQLSLFIKLGHTVNYN